jgi:hypothetical protein
MQKKLLIISAILIFISTVLYGTLLFKQSGSEEPQGASQESPSATGGKLLTEGNISTAPLIKPNASPELLAKIKKLLPGWKSLGADIYTVAEVPTLDAPSMIPDFTIIYNSQNTAFTVTLYRDSLLENRQRAGDMLMRTLEIDQEEVCLLDVQVVIPKSVNANYANKNLKLPFCQNFTDLRGVSADQGVSNIVPNEKDPNSFAL